jgi:hypothetical protein
MRHTREDSGAVVSSLRRPPLRASCVGTAPAPGSLGSARPETSRGLIRLAHAEQDTGFHVGDTRRITGGVKNQTPNLAMMTSTITTMQGVRVFIIR